MNKRPTSRYSKSLILAFGLMLIIFGTVTIIYPEIMTRYGLIIEDVHAKSTIMAVIGGSEIGLGLFILIGQKFEVSIDARLGLLLLVFTGIFAARIFSAFLYHAELPGVFFRELFAELLITIMLIIALYREKFSPR